MDTVKNEKIMRKEMEKIQKNFLKQIDSYKNYIRQCELDAPIEVLCLPNEILNILKRNGFSRVANICAADLTKIKGLGQTRLAVLQSCLDKFLPV
jgi:hypothetical protein